MLACSGLSPIYSLAIAAFGIGQFCLVRNQWRTGRFHRSGYQCRRDSVRILYSVLVSHDVVMMAQIVSASFGQYANTVALKPRLERDQRELCDSEYVLLPSNVAAIPGQAGKQ